LLKKSYSSLGDGVTSFEVMWANYFDEVIDTVEQAASPFQQSYPFYALIEYQGQDHQQDNEKFSSVLFETMESGLVADAVIAQSAKQTASFWQIRDGIGELLATMGPVVNTDISVPISQMKNFVEQLESSLYEAFPTIKLRIFGHIGDSNLHLCAGTGLAEDLDAISANIMNMTGQFKGSVSAEHGIGVLKKKYLHYSRTPEEIELMRALKNTMDPNGILNAGRVI
ncbi:MAG: FAD-binding oxidoreductase, partial [Gammaproteobacteria bacterium]|nr:FAD-binding oxidoreductase [Gammaproteobacteria bacterium]